METESRRTEGWNDGKGLQRITDIVLNPFFVPSLVMRRCTLWCGSILFMFSFELHKICYGRITMYMYNKRLLPFLFTIIWHRSPLWYCKIMRKKNTVFSYFLIYLPVSTWEKNALVYRSLFQLLIYHWKYEISKNVLLLSPDKVVNYVCNVMW